MYFFSSLRPMIMLVAACTLQQVAHAQYSLTEATRAYNLFNLEDAKPLFAKAWKKKPSAEAARGAADSYRLTKDYVIAEEWYAKLWLAPGHTPEDELHYAAVLMNNSKYKEAALHLKNYLDTIKHDVRAQHMLAGCDSAGEWLAHPQPGTIENMQVLNSAYSDWSITFNNNKFIFASDRPYDSLRKPQFFDGNYIRRRNYSWTGHSYLHLYESDGTDSAHIRLLNRQFVNGDYHSASASYTVDGKRMYLAITTLIKKRGSFLGDDSLYTINIAVKEIKQDSAQHWKKTPSLPFNEALQYSVGDPWISPGGDTLYFASSEGPGHYGGTDLYYCLYNNGQWSKPVNMGASINTEGNERTPYFDAAGKFYFASDGHPGIGGLDIYTARKTGDTTWSVTNAGSPVNSPQDDFAPAVINGVLYLSSNRENGKGSDDIYRFKPYHQLKLTGIVTDTKTNKPIPAVIVTLENKATGRVFTIPTDDHGRYTLPMDTLTDYKLTAYKTDYTTSDEIPVSTKQTIDTITRVEKDLVLEHTPLKNPVQIKNIYFDLGKSDIRPDAAAELNKLVTLLNDNPTLEIEMGSHTDSRASDAYNLALSQRRATATVAYLIKQGVDAKRLTAKGYGETKLVNGCANGVPCSEAAHQVNRRTEFTILLFDK